MFRKQPFFAFFNINSVPASIIVTCSAGADISKMMFSNHFMIIQVALIHIKAASLSVFEELFLSSPHILSSSLICFLIRPPPECPRKTATAFQKVVNLRKFIKSYFTFPQTGAIILFEKQNE